MMAKSQDPRLYQIMCLAGMFAYGLFWLKFDLGLWEVGGILGIALAAQALGSRWRGIAFEWKSALISGLSLCLLMRTDSLPLAFALSAAAISSKFLIRWRGKHVFNPTNFALALGILLSSHVWISPGQWGNGAILAFFIVSMGTFVVNRAARSDVTFLFLVMYAVMLLIFKEPLARMKMGSLLVFAFFMISDPKTTPNSRYARVLFAVGVAGLASYLVCCRSNPSGVILSLAFLSPAVPLLDRLFPASSYTWPTKRLASG